MLKVGDIVQNKWNKVFGTVEYSTNGFSIHSWSTHIDGTRMLSKTLNSTEEEILEHWNKVDKPAGYRTHAYGGLVKEEEL